MSNFLKYMRLFALGITFSSSMALPYVQIKFYDVFREATQASNNELGLLMTIFTRGQHGSLYPRRGCSRTAGLQRSSCSFR